MKSICMLLALSCGAWGRPQLPHSFLGGLQPTQLPPLRADELGDQAGFEARTYQTGYRLHNTGYRAPPDTPPASVGYPTQVPPIRGDEADDQGGRERYDNRRYQGQIQTQTTGYRLQNTQQSYGSSQATYQDYGGQYRPQAIDYRASTPKDIVPILTYSNDVAYDGSYNYNYESADGSSRQESGVMVADAEGAGPSVRGSYSYTSPEGQLITVHYVADKDGFRAEGAHLPTPPPMPEAIAKSLEFNARARASQPAGYEDDGQYHPERTYRNQDLYSS